MIQIFSTDGRTGPIEGSTKGPRGPKNEKKLRCILNQIPPFLVVCVGRLRYHGEVVCDGLVVAVGGEDVISRLQLLTPPPHPTTTPTWSTQFPPRAVNFDFASVFVGVVLVVSLLFLPSNFQLSALTSH